MAYGNSHRFLHGPVPEVEEFAQPIVIGRLRIVGIMSDQQPLVKDHWHRKAGRQSDAASTEDPTVYTSTDVAA